MQFSRIALFVTILASASVMSHVLTERQTDCSTYGDYPEYTGPCSDTDCGEKRTNCYAKYQDCVSYPNQNCPARGCTCSNM